MSRRRRQRGVRLRVIPALLAADRASKEGGEKYPPFAAGLECVVAPTKDALRRGRIAGEHLDVTDHLHCVGDGRLLSGVSVEGTAAGRELSSLVERAEPRVEVPQRVAQLGLDG